MSDAEVLTATEPTAPSSDTAPARRSGRRGEEIAKILFVVPAALSNILILISLVFAIVYLRATRRQVDE